MFFKNIVKEKKLIDRELEVYRKEKLAEVTTAVAESWLENRKQLAEDGVDYPALETLAEKINEIRDYLHEQEERNMTAEQRQHREFVKSNQ